MSRARHLVMGTGSWPWSHSQEHTFIDPEIGHLARTFEQVVVVPQIRAGTMSTVPSTVVVRDDFADSPGEPSFLRHARKLKSAVSAVVLREAFERGVSTRSSFAIRRVLAAGERGRHWERAIKRIIQDEKLDPASTVLYSYWCDDWVLGASTLGSARAVACRMHGFDLREERHSPPFIPFREVVLHRLDAVFHVSDAGAAYLRARYPFVDERSRVARLGVDDPGAEARASTDGMLRIVSCSSVIPLKRVDLLFRGLCRLAELHPSREFAWTHLGGGPGLDALRAEQGRAPQNLRVDLRGQLEYAELLAHYKASPVDLFLHVSSTEGLPVALQEAASFGVPIVSTRVGGVGEIVSDRNGRLLSENPEPSEVAATCWEVLGDPELRAWLARGSRATWEERFDANKNHSRFAGELAELKRA